jgi:hypothetical protein
VEEIETEKEIVEIFEGLLVGTLPLKMKPIESKYSAYLLGLHGRI